MKQWVRWIFVSIFLILLSIGVAQAEQRSSYNRTKNRSADQTDDFSQSVDLSRFRRGNIEWDTQELVASGFQALHRDHVKMMEQLEEIKAALKEIEKEKDQKGAAK